MTTTPCCHCNVSLVCSPCPGAFTTLRAGQIEINIHFCIKKKFIFILFPWKNTFFSLQMFTLAHTVQYPENTILDKNVKKNARCICNFRILPSKARFTQDIPPSPQKSNVEVWPEHFCCLLNNIDQGGVGEGSPWFQIRRVGLLCVRKSKILKTFCPRL